MLFLYCSDFHYILSYYNTTIPTVTVVCAGALAITMAVMITCSQQDELPPPLLFLMDSVKGVAGFAAVPQEQPVSQMGP